MRGMVALAALLTIIAPAVADATQSKRLARTTPAKDTGNFIPKPAELEAAIEVSGCASNAMPGRPVELCNRTWKGIKWLLYSNWNAQLDMPSGGRWLVSCKYDAIEREDRCTFTTGDQFAIVRSDGYATLVNWGLQRFPGSAMTTRFDDAAPISTTAETWTEQQSRMIYRRMLAGKLMRYRFSDWPNNATHDGQIDLTSFRDAAALMEAIRNEFTVARVLKKVSVPE